jgi:hypothetical protein
MAVVLPADGEIDAETRPETATNRANMRIAVFIFGNLAKWMWRGNFLSFRANRTLVNAYKSNILNKIDSNSEYLLLTSPKWLNFATLVTTLGPATRSGSIRRRMIKSG